MTNEDMGRASNVTDADMGRASNMTDAEMGRASNMTDADTGRASDVMTGDTDRASNFPERRVQLLHGDEMEGVVARWREIQAEFVDEPRKAIKEADDLVTELMERLTRTFASEREQLEARWREGQDVSTEDLRQGLQRYRSFFERLLAA